jgi:hypothetical protein
MNTRCALVDDAGLVVNVILADPDGFLPPDGLALRRCEDAAPGDRWNGGTFLKPAPPPAPVPDAITALQARRALRQAGLLSAAIAAVNAAADSDPDALDAFEYATTWRRDAPWVGRLAPAIGLSSVQVDDLFRAGATM